MHRIGIGSAGAKFGLALALGASASLGMQTGAWAMSEAEEARLGKETAYIEQSMGGVLAPNHPMQQRVEKIGKRFARLARPRSFGYRYRVLASPHVLNAFAAPGGTIYITSRLVKFSRSDDELASILGHETAHVSQRHIAREVDDRNAFVLFGERLQKMSHDAAQKNAKSAKSVKKTPKVQRSAMSEAMGGSPMANLSWYLLSRGRARSMETEADALSARWMKKLGYNPRAAITLLKRADAALPNSASPLTSLLASHPGVERRIADLKQLIEDEKLDLATKAKATAKATAQVAVKATATAIKAAAQPAAQPTPAGAPIVAPTTASPAGSAPTEPTSN